MEEQNNISISFVPFNNNTYAFIIRDEDTYEEVTFEGNLEDLFLTDNQKEMLYKVAPMCVMSKYKEVENDYEF